MIKEIIRDQNFLSQPAKPATRQDLQVCQDLQDTLLAHQDHCVGLAANMIGAQKQIIIVLLGVLPVVLINPKITQQRGKYITQEGCLSLIGERPATRYQEITVTYLNKDFQPVTQQFTDFPAQIIQHEMDHCQGILI